ncbi:hypothetical protein BHE74_00026046 [Ensete ventricosum]|nr:hypothetical protein BHE74_00026046 [Ensete ventricosum]
MGRALRLGLGAKFHDNVLTQERVLLTLTHARSDSGAFYTECMTRGSVEARPSSRTPPLPSPSAASSSTGHLCSSPPCHRRRPSLPTLLFLSSFPIAAAARRCCPLPPSATSISPLPTTAAGHPYHLPSFSRLPHQVVSLLPYCTCLLLPASATRRSDRCPHFLLQKIAAVVAVVALAGLGHCLLPLLPAASSPRPPAASSYASSPRPATAAKPSSNAPAPTVGQPLSFSSIAAKALIDAAAVLLLCLLCLLCHCNHHNLLLGRTFLCHRGTLIPSSFLAAATAPKCRHCPSCHCRRPPLFLPSASHDVAASSLIAACYTPAVAPPCYQCFIL